MIGSARRLWGVLLLAVCTAGAQAEGKGMSDPRIEEAGALMRGFAERTGLTSQTPPRRYLWTDAFAVCNFLGLSRTTGDEAYAELAGRLVAQVHRTLGRHRGDDGRSGWLSGLGERAGEAHPTRGGLRIGKRLPERAPGEPFDEVQEWDRDGQYYHYLTKWMHALDQVTRASGEPRFNLWARELAEVAYAGFTYATVAGRPRRMHWKMSIDLSRALVPSMGQHDPLDGYLTQVQLRSTASRLPDSVGGPGLETETDELRAMVEGGAWGTTDPLGLGDLLTDAYRAQQLRLEGALADDRLLATLLAAALTGLEEYAASGELGLPAHYRLAFRELGLAIGLHAVTRMLEAVDRDARLAVTTPAVRTRLQALLRFVPLGEAIEAFWRAPEHHSAASWAEHRDINEVMLATRLAPEGFLVLLSPSRGD